MKKISVMILIMATIFAVGCQKLKKGLQNNSSGSKPAAANQVTVDMHVMSHCPFGVQAENGMFPAIEKLNSDKTYVKLNLHFIGQERGGKLSSMHGPKEVAGDKIQICAAKYFPNNYMKLITCMNKNPRQIPDNFDSCAKTSGINVAIVKKCADGAEGTKLLKDSFALSAKKRANGSPTIFIGGDKYRGGRSVRDFMTAICNKFKTNTPPACKNIPKPAKVTLTVLTDKRCKKCNAERFVGMMKGRFFPGLDSKIVDYNTPEGKKLYAEMAKSGQKLLPMLLFADDVKKAPSYNRLRRYFTVAGKYNVLRSGAKFDPTKEICDNKKDDTGNGKIDCDDPDCKEAMVCRKEIKNKLDVFVMSHCPFGTKALDSMKEVIKNFGKNIKFDIHYIAQKRGDNFSSMHGPAEVAEDLREICVKNMYPKNYKFMDYIWCRDKNIRSNDWQSCAKEAKMNVKAIEKCSTGKKGKELLSKSIAITDGLGIGASPTWLINNKFKGSGITAEQVKQNLCRYNKGLKGCENKLSNNSKVKGSCGN